jgi:hypothetical protein
MQNGTSRRQHHCGARKPPEAGGRPTEGEKDKNAGRSLRNQIRGVQRLLKRDLDVSARSMQQTKLASLQAQQKEKERSNLERKMTLRYRKVWFAIVLRGFVSSIAVIEMQQAALAHAHLQQCDLRP